MDFLIENEAAIDFTNGVISSKTPETAEDKWWPRITPEKRANTDVTAVTSQHVNLPPLSSVLVTATCDRPPTGCLLAEGNTQLLHERGMGIARGTVPGRNGTVELLVTNFHPEAQHLANGTNIAVIVYQYTTTDVCLMDASRIAVTAEHDAGHFDVNSQLNTTQKQTLLQMLNDFSDCFAALSKVRQTPIAKHRIIVGENARPIHRMPYRVSCKERETIRKQVEEMLRDDIIQPSTSPWRRRTEHSGSASTTGNPMR
ncbi:uncharacterized protein LOC135376100 [Ornithodoros turicata]|uniref:uncharacterized protein LOC135376100 n=1 Tax=Ornithodoros turicata TaxID=34597 RepID=UPI003139569B